jgi:hypothetical protein
LDDDKREQRVPTVFSRADKHRALGPALACDDALRAHLLCYAEIMPPGYHTILDLFADAAPYTTLSSLRGVSSASSHPHVFFSYLKALWPRICQTDSVILRATAVLMEIAVQYNLPPEIGGMIAVYLQGGASSFCVGHARIGLPRPVGDLLSPLVLLPCKDNAKGGAFSI